MHRISHRPRAACSSVHQHRCCESSDRSPTATPGQHANQADAACESRAPGPSQIEALTQSSMKIAPLTVGLRLPQGSCFPAETTCHAGSFMHMCLWVQKMQNDTGNSALEIFNRVTLIKLALKDTDSVSRTKMCVGSGKRHCQLT